jgi:hypothetical protein
VQLFFFEMTSAVAKAKADIIRGKAAQILKAAQQDNSILDAPLPQAHKAADKHGSHDLAKLMKEGLPENPEAEIVKLWVRRATQDVATSGQKIPLTREMVDMAAKSDAAYLPLWASASQAIVGSTTQVHCGVPHQQWKSGEAARLDLAAFFASVFQLCSMHAKGQNALVVIPVRAATLMDKDIADLYFAVLGRLPPDTRRNIVLDVKGMPKDGAPISIVSALDTAARLVRAYIFETGLLSYPDFSRQFPKLYAAGFDSGDVHLGEHEQVRHMTKYAAHYKATNAKACVMKVSSRHVFDAALREGFAYISGTLIRPAQKAGFAVQRLAPAEIGGG